VNEIFKNSKLCFPIMAIDVSLSCPSRSMDSTLTPHALLLQLQQVALERLCHDSMARPSQDNADVASLQEPPLPPRLPLHPGRSHPVCYTRDVIGHSARCGLLGNKLHVLGDCMHHVGNKHHLQQL
jgi:hypothetical protein